MRKAIWYSESLPPVVGDCEFVAVKPLATSSKEDVAKELLLLSSIARQHGASYVFGAFSPALRSIADMRSSTAVLVGDYSHEELEMMEPWGSLWLGVGSLPILGEGESPAKWVLHL